MQGIPLIASSPVRHESPLGLNPVEVHAFAPPWKALAEFALHNDLERIDPSTPHFQQLINQVRTEESFPSSGYCAPRTGLSLDLPSESTEIRDWSIF